MSHNLTVTHINTLYIVSEHMKCTEMVSLQITVTHMSTLYVVVEIMREIMIYITTPFGVSEHIYVKGYCNLGVTFINIDMHKHV